MSDKNRKWWVFICILCLLLISLGFYSISGKDSEIQTQTSAGGPEDNSSTITEPVASATSPGEDLKVPNDVSEEKKSWIKRAQKIKSKSNKDLQFFGKVVDQNGKPVPQANVVIGLTYHTNYFEEGLRPQNESILLKTDSQGRFSIKNQKGTGLFIRKIKKEGYKGNLGYKSIPPKYSFPRGSKVPANPSRENPVVFTLWKKQEPADLIQGSKKVGGIGGRGAYYPNESFQTVRIPATDGAVQIRFRTDPEGEQYNPGDWSVTLKIENGGLIEAEKVYMYEAPREGYQSTWQASFEKGKEGFKSEIRRKFYLKAKGGSIYGRLEMNFDPYVGEVDGEKTSGLSFKYRINPHGSRNLLGKYD